MPYRWEPTAGVSGRYRDERGRFVASSTVRRELDRYLDNSDPAKALAEALRGRQLSVADWEVAFRRHIKNTHLNAIALERGGWANLTPSDFGRVGQIVREQYGYLRGFANDIASGKQRLDGTLGVRASLYTQAGRESFYRSKQANLQPGIDMVMSVRHARDSCAECIALEGKWFKVGDPAYKLPGQRICLKRCHCTERYGRMTADGVVAVDGTDTAPLSSPTSTADKTPQTASTGAPALLPTSAAEARRMVIQVADETADSLRLLDKDIAQIEEQSRKMADEIEAYDKKRQSEALRAGREWLPMSDAKYLEMTNRYFDMQGPLYDLVEKRNGIEASLAARARALLYVSNPTKFDVIFDYTGPRDEIERGLEEFKRLVPAGSLDGKTIRIRPIDPALSTGGRAYALRDGFAIGERGGSATVIHEMGHVLEYSDPAMLRRSNRFLLQRTRGETAQSLSSLVPGGGHMPSEMAWPDEFIHPYMGKVYYGEASEVVSMGLQMFYHEPARLARDDPGYFEFIYNTLRGIE